MKKIVKFLFLSLLLVSLVGCKPKNEEVDWKAHAIEITPYIIMHTLNYECFFSEGIDSLYFYKDNRPKAIDHGDGYIEVIGTYIPKDSKGKVIPLSNYDTDEKKISVFYHVDESKLIYDEKTGKALNKDLVIQKINISEWIDSYGEWLQLWRDREKDGTENEWDWSKVRDAHKAAK